MQCIFISRCEMPWQFFGLNPINQVQDFKFYPNIAHFHQWKKGQWDIEIRLRTKNWPKSLWNLSENLQICESIIFQISMGKMALYFHQSVYDWNFDFPMFKVMVNHMVKRHKKKDWWHEGWSCYRRVDLGETITFFFIVTGIRD